MRFLIDESTGQAVVQRPRQLVHDVAAVAEEIPQADDDLIIIKALAEERILVTNDKDFGEKVYRDSRGHAGILLLRLKDDRATVKAQVAESVIQRFGEQLQDNFTVATQDRVRNRRPWH